VRKKTVKNWKRRLSEIESFDDNSLVIKVKVEYIRIINVM
jgi:hypothetical protein